MHKKISENQNLQKRETGVVQLVHKEIGYGKNQIKATQQNGS